MARRKRVEADLAAWAKAHEAEAKRAERAAKIGGDIGEAWLTYAGKCRREAVEVIDVAPIERRVGAAEVYERRHQDESA